MLNPFDEKYDANETDVLLIRSILNGSRKDLEILISRHQAWIYNIALKMVMDPRDAEDVTQEILIKLLTKLSTYNAEKASFRTWLYRIVANHVLNMKKRKYEKLFSSFEECAVAAEAISDETMDASPENLLLIEELKIKCLAGLLLCLDRKQRLVFILGEIFDTGSRIGSSITDLSEANYRQTLSRSRKLVSNFISRNCGLVNPENPCHCHKKLKGLIREGFVDPDNLLFYKDKINTIQDIIWRNKQHLKKFARPENLKLFQEQPFYTSPDFEKWISRALSSDTLKTLMAIN